MKLIIDIPEEKYNMIKNKMYCGIYDAEVYESIANGTPLPKGHGKIGDLDRLYNVFEKNVVSADAFKELFDYAPTIIEADTEESNTDNKSDDELYADAIDAFKVYATGRK